ncbi:MAG: T9SS type A sorting domain-containing protein [Rhodothermales bacterium]|nr:T9SS type A sorting domain-containing protein [Rhodothermales bacterium]
MPSILHYKPSFRMITATRVVARRVSNLVPVSSMLMLLLLALGTTDVLAQIRSTTTGGDWSEPSTWEGNLVPEVDDEVIISAGADVAMQGLLECAGITIEQGATLRRSDNLTLEVHGDFVNRGIVLGDVGLLLLEGDVLNTGQVASRVFYGGNGPRTIIAPGIDSDVQWVTGFVSLEGRNVLSRLNAVDDRGGQLILERGGTIEFSVTPEVGYKPAELDTPDQDQFASFGTVIMPNVPDQFANVVVGSNMRAGFDQSVTSADTIWAETYGDQAHPRFANSVRNWFRLRWADSAPSPRPELLSLLMTFNARHLGDLDPDSLSVFHSPDSGRTWQQLTEPPFAVTFDPSSGVGFASLLNVTSEGDFVIAAPGPPVAARPVADIQLLGRNQIRVGGPPQRYRVYYTNAGSVPMGRTIIGLRTEGGAYIDRIVPSSAKDEAVGWGVEQFAPDGDSTEALVMTSPLGPGETRAFTAYLKAVPDAGKVGSEAVVQIVGGIVLGIGAGYLSDVLFHALEEVMADPCNNDSGYKDKFNDAFDRTDDKWNPFGSSESPWLAVSENGASGLSQIGALKSGFGVVTAVNLLNSAASTVANGTARYEQNSGRSMFEPIDCDAPPRPNVPNDQLPMDPVSSFDPNSKVGPGGAGTLNFVSAAGKMEYVINFENKAEATAPAFRIVITDTLRPELDPNSVRFGPVSHDGWTTTRVGNVLTWDIEGIELPPNVNPPEGEGFVSFTVDAADGLPSGTVISNRAEIIFDLNEPILTNTHVNTIDFEAPITTMSSLPAEVEGDRVAVAWTSDDLQTGSGVASAAVYASVDGSAFELIGFSESNSFTAPVRPGRRYLFYALASDRVGNTEKSRPTPVATTVIATDVVGSHGFAFELGANYPNPFTEETSISFVIPSRERVRLSVFDLLGREVARIVDQVLSAGPHTVTWRGGAMASGVYIYRLRAGTREESGSLIVVK